MPGAIKSLITLVLRLGLGGLFVYAGVLKLEDPQEFANAIKAYDILPNHLIIVSAFAFPWLEVLAGGMLVLGLWTRAASLTILALLGGFLFAIISVMARDVVVPECSCFGKAGFLCSGPPGWCHIGQDAVMVLAGLGTLILGGGAVSVDRMVERTSKAGRPGTGDYGEQV